jgi:glycogen synthase
MNTDLEGTVQKGRITYKSKQICAHANATVVIVRNTAALKEVLLALETEGRKMGFTVNEKKTKYVHENVLYTSKELSPASEIRDFKF